MKSEARRLTARRECTSGDGIVTCALDCDGRGLTVRCLDEANRIEIGFTEGQRIRMGRGCAAESDTHNLTPSQDGHRFRLMCTKVYLRYSVW